MNSKSRNNSWGYMNNLIIIFINFSDFHIIQSHIDIILKNLNILVTKKILCSNN